MNILKQYIKNLASSVGRRHPELIVRVRYALRFHRRLNLRQPSDLNEKIQYLSLRTDTTEWSRLSDKYAVRQYVADCGLADILNTLYGVWDNADDIPFDTLPQRFVLKTTHGSGDSILVTDKSALDVAAVKATLRDTLGTTYGLAEGLDGEEILALTQVLAQDPRPRYQDDPEREYGMEFAGRNVRFRVIGRNLTVCSISTPDGSGDSQI